MAYLIDVYEAESVRVSDIVGGNDNQHLADLLDDAVKVGLVTVSGNNYQLKLGMEGMLDSLSKDFLVTLVPKGHADPVAEALWKVFIANGITSNAPKGKEREAIIKFSNNIKNALRTVGDAKKLTDKNNGILNDKNGPVFVATLSLFSVLTERGRGQLRSDEEAKTIRDNEKTTAYTLGGFYNDSGLRQGVSLFDTVEIVPLLKRADGLGIIVLGSDYSAKMSNTWYGVLRVLSDELYQGRLTP